MTKSKLLIVVAMAMGMAGQATAADFDVTLAEVVAGGTFGEFSASSISGTTTGRYNETTGIVTMDTGATTIEYLVNFFTTYFTHIHTNWTTGGGGYSAAGYSCVEGEFAAVIAASICGNYNYGGNLIDESTLDYNTVPGTRVIGGDDEDVFPQWQGSYYATTTSSGPGGGTLIMRTANWNNLGPGGESTAGITLVFTATEVLPSEGVVGSDGGTVTSPDESVTLTVPAGVLDETVTFTFTETGRNFELTNNSGEVIGVYGYEIDPAGTTFNPPYATLILAWDDTNNDGIVDGTTNVKEDNLKITKDGSAITDQCKQSPGPDWSCDTDANTFTVTIMSLSEFILFGPKDSDGDGVPDNYEGVIDACPNEDARGSDADGDGCIDPIAIIDVHPGSDPNSINPDAEGLIPVAILTTSISDGDTVEFDATQVDPFTLYFGPGETPISHDRPAHFDDIDQDTDTDMVAHFDTQPSAIGCGDTEVTLHGLTLSGAAFSGTDTIITTSECGEADSSCH